MDNMYGSFVHFASFSTVNFLITIDFKDVADGFGAFCLFKYDAVVVTASLILFTAVVTAFFGFVLYIIKLCIMLVPYYQQL